jgi:hypothetical protein
MERINSTVGNIYLECAEDNIWKIFFQDETHKLDKNDYRVILSLLPFLEIGREKVLETVKDEFKRKSIPEELIVEAGFIQGSEYWVNLALVWLVKMEHYDERLFIKYFEDMINNKKYGQKLRHSLVKLIKNK